MIYFLIIFSFYLEGLCSMLFKSNLFLPLFSLLSLVLIYPYFRKLVFYMILLIQIRFLYMLFYFVC